MGLGFRNHGPVISNANEELGIQHAGKLISRGPAVANSEICHSGCSHIHERGVGAGSQVAIMYVGVGRELESAFASPSPSPTLLPTRHLCICSRGDTSCVPVILCKKYDNNNLLFRRCFYPKRLD